MANPVAKFEMLLPTYETSMRKCARCPERYLEVKRIGEEGHRLCAGCYAELVAETVIYGYDAFERHGRPADQLGAGEDVKNNCHVDIPPAAIEESACYWRQVAENKTHKLL